MSDPKIKKLLDRMIPKADAEDLTNEDVELSLLTSGMSDDDIEAVREDAPLEDDS